MRFDEGLKDILIGHLSEAFEEKIPIEDFNEVFLFLDRWNGSFKLVPYGIFENKEYLTILDKTPEGQVFKKWIEVQTSNIKKDFNKGRKFVRIIKELTTKHQGSLPFNLPVANIFLTALTAFFIEDYRTQSPFIFEVKDEERFNKALYSLRRYLATVSFIDFVDDSIIKEQILKIFIKKEKSEIVGSLLELGVIYNHKKSF